MIKAPKKLIEVALPLDDINIASAREKSIRHGHPSTLHLWWARRPLAAARAVLFAQLVNDPGGERGWGKYPGQTKEDAQRERENLFKILRDLVKWENTNNEHILQKARKAIKKSWQETCEMNEGKEGFNPNELPDFHDPFAGGGAIPLEAQRFGLKSYASDLNPVAVMINKAMIEIPPVFVDQKPVNPKFQNKKDLFDDIYLGSQGLSKDVRYYGDWIRKRAFERIGTFYPRVEITNSMAKNNDKLKSLVGQKLTVIAWFWARTVKSPNPAFSDIDVPLVKSFVLSKKKNKEAWIESIVSKNDYSFIVRYGEVPDAAKSGTKIARGANFRCILSGSPIESNYIKSEGVKGRIGKRLLVVVVNGPKGRLYIQPNKEMEKIAESAQPTWHPKGKVPKKLTGGTCFGYGLSEWSKLFTQRQLLALDTFSDLVNEAREQVIADAKKAGMIDDGKGLDDGGYGATAYGDAISVYLAFAVDYAANYWSTIATPAEGFIRGTFSRQALPMTWDFAETNIFGSTSGNWMSGIEWIEKVLTLLMPPNKGIATQADAASQDISNSKIVSTDPPYYDNIAYADLSDYFYVWLRKSLRQIFPSVFSTIAVPKSEELVANAFRHGNKEKAENFFLEGMTNAIKNLSLQVHSGFPVTIYYAFKQDVNIASTGWEIFLEAVIKSGFAITGTWPMRTERGARTVGLGTNALASSIILVCRKRNSDNVNISRREFQRELKKRMPEALETMIGGSEGTSPIAPVDLAQAAIGPGMAMFSKYSAVLEADGSPMSVHDALVQINREIDDYFNAAEGDLDPDSRFCIDWFQQYGFQKGPFGEADVVARAKGTSVDAVATAGVIRSGGGKVQLLTFSDYPQEWDPDKDPYIPIWEATHQLIRALRHGGEKESGFLLSRLPGKTEQIRQLAYRLYTLCERQSWAEEARAYNELISSWHRIVSASEDIGVKGEQMDLF